MFVAGLVHVSRHFIDYPVYETAAKRILAGEATSLYANPGHSTNDLYYAYAFALAMAPFAWLGSLGKLLFFFLFFLAYLKTLFFAQKTAFRLLEVQQDSPFRPIVLWGLVLLTAYAANDGFMNANIGPLLLAMGILAYEWRDERPALAGLLLGAAIVFKTYPVILLGYFVWEKRWPLVFTTLTSVAVLLLGLPVLIYGIGPGGKMLSQYFFLIAHHREMWAALGWNYGGHVFQSIPGTFIRYGSLVGVPLNSAYRTATLVSVIAVLAFYLKGFLSDSKALSDSFKERMFLLTLAIVPMIIPVSWYNVGLFYTPVIAYVLTKAIVQRSRRDIIALSAYALLYCLCTPDIIGRPLNAVLCFYSLPWASVVGLIAVYLLDVVALSDGFVPFSTGHRFALNGPQESR